MTSILRGDMPSTSQAGVHLEALQTDWRSVDHQSRMNTPMFFGCTPRTPPNKAWRDQVHVQPAFKQRADQTTVSEGKIPLRLQHRHISTLLQDFFRNLSWAKAPPRFIHLLNTEGGNTLVNPPTSSVSAAALRRWRSCISFSDFQLSLNRLLLCLCQTYACLPQHSRWT